MLPGIRFLFLLLATAALLRAAPRELVTGNELHHTDLHIKVTKPESWRFLTPKEKRKARNALTYRDKTVDLVVKQTDFPPRIVVARYAEPHKGLNPRVEIDLYPLGQFRFKDGLWVIDRVLGGWQRILSGPLDVPVPPRWSEISGKPAGYYRARYELEVVKLPTLKIEERAWAVSLPLGVILIQAFGAQDGPEQCLEELDAILASIQFDVP